MADIIAVILVMGLFVWVGWMDRGGGAAKRDAERHFAELERNQGSK